MSALEMWRRRVLENPDRYGALERAAAWDLTAAQCKGFGVEWAAGTARRESVIAALTASGVR